MRHFNPTLLNRPHKRGNPEAHLVLQIIKYAKVCGAYAGKIKVKGSFSKQGNFIFDPYLSRGIPDVLIFHKDIMYLVECKVGKNTLTQEQEVFKQFFHKPPDRIFVEARQLEDVSSVIK